MKQLEKLIDRVIIRANMNLREFDFDGEDEWENGKIYDPKNGKDYKCYMEFEDDTKDNLKVRGYIGFSMIGRTTHWTRVK